MTIEGLPLPCPLTMAGAAQGRAYHAGDVVLLRIGTNRREAWERAREALDGLEAKTGIVFVLLAGDVEVVEPREVEA